MIYAKRLPILMTILAMACADPSLLPPDDTPNDSERPPDDGPQAGVELAEPYNPISRMQGLKVPEDGDNQPIPLPGDRGRDRDELARLEAELSAILAPILARLDERGVTREQLEQAIGDIWAERMLLGLSLPEYYDVQRQIESVVERARPLLDVPRPLTRDGRGGGEEICTTDRTVDERDDGTIIIHDHKTCRPGFPEDGGSPGGCLLGGPGCGDGPGGWGGGGGSPPDFATACLIEGGKVENGRCQCSRGSKCKGSLWRIAGATIPCLFSLPWCIGTALAWADFAWQCNQRPCDEINRRYKR